MAYIKAFCIAWKDMKFFLYSWCEENNTFKSQAHDLVIVIYDSSTEIKIIFEILYY